MSEFNPRDFDGDDIVKCGCGHKHPAYYQLKKCEHPGCETRTCYYCARMCEFCGQKLCCEDHLWRTTFKGSLSKPIEVCEKCRTEELDEAVDALEKSAEIEGD